MERVCIYCQQDCSHVPRVKNVQGQYACAACSPGSAAGTLQAAPTDLSSRHRAPCPNCGAASVVGIPSCGTCGHAPSLEQGMVPRPKRKQKKQALQRLCKACGYDLAGITAAVCPECGSNSGYVRHDWDEETSQEVERLAYRSPLLWGGGAVAVALIVTGASGSVSMVAQWLICFSASLAIGATTTFVACALWAGFPASLALMALQLAATHALVVMPLAVVGRLLYFSTPGIVLISFLYAVLLSELLDLDGYEARIIACISTGIQLVLLMVARSRGWI